jgi:predicted nucleic acid-binding protein
MKKVFVDTSAFLALLNNSDTWHKKAKEIELFLNQNRYLWVTTDFVILELGDALCSVYWRSKFTRFVNVIRDLESISIIPLEEKLFNQGLALYESRQDKDWGLTDCISFVIMQRENITEAFTTDKHFEQAGFIRLLT